MIWHGINGDGQGWRRDPRLLRAYTWATLLWALVFAARVVVQGLLYRYDEETWLGIARLAMGYPLVGVALLGTIWAVRRARRPRCRPPERPRREGAAVGDRQRGRTGEVADEHLSGPGSVAQRGPDVLLHRLRRDEDQLVAGLQGSSPWGHDHALAAQDRHQRGVAGSGTPGPPDRRAARRRAA